MTMTAQALESELEGTLLRPLHQERSREKLERLVQAGFKLLNERGFDAMKIADLACEAGCQVSTFYQRFQDKDALLAVMQLRSHQMLRTNLENERFFGKLRELPPGRIAETVVARFLKGYSIGEKLIRELIRRSSVNPAIEKTLKLTGIYLRESLVEALRPRFGEFTHPDPAFAIGLTIEAFFGIMANILVYDAGPAGLRDPRLRNEMIVMFERYVGIEVPEAAQAARKSAAAGE
jgi:AcrR family transcriptional regulator